MNLDKLGGFITWLIIVAIEILIGIWLYQFIDNRVIKLIFIIYVVFAFIIAIEGAIYFTDEDNLM